VLINKLSAVYKNGAVVTTHGKIKVWGEGDFGATGQG